MNQTKKRLSIIELAISITDIETIKLQMIQLTPLRTDDKIDEILSLLETGNYAHAQNLIPLYIEGVHDTVIQRIPEVEEIPQNEEQAIIDEYDFLSESSTELENDTEADVENNTEEESIDSITIDNQESISIEENETDIHNIESHTIEESSEEITDTTDYTSLLDIDPDEILAQNIQLDLSDKTRETIKKEKTDFDLETIPKDDFFNTPSILEESIADEEAEEKKIYKEDIQEIDEIEEDIKKEKVDFNLDSIPKDDFFDDEVKTIHEEQIGISDTDNIDTLFTLNDTEEEIVQQEETHIEEVQPIPEAIETPHIDTSKSENLTAIQKQTNNETEIKTVVTTKDTFYPAIVNIYAIFQDIRLTYPAVHQTNSYSDMLEVWLEKIADEGYSEAEVEEILIHIEQLALENKAEAAQFLQVTSRTESKYAKFILARALYRGTLLERNLDESFKIMSYLAFDEKYPEALCDLAQFYENGIGIEKDKMQAELLYKEAMDLGVTRAKNHYARIQKESKGFFSFLKR